MSGFHPTTITILKHVLDEQRRDVTLYQRRLEHADKVTPKNDGERERFPRVAATFRKQIAELTAVVADFEELLRFTEAVQRTDAQLLAESAAGRDGREVPYVVLTPDQLAGTACAVCGRDFAVGESTAPAGVCEERHLYMHIGGCPEGAGAGSDGAL